MGKPFKPPIHITMGRYVGEQQRYHEFSLFLRDSFPIELSFRVVAIEYESDRGVPPMCRYVLKDNDKGEIQGVLAAAAVAA